MARYGTGLSAEQKNDFSLFKERWEQAMLRQYGPEWPHRFTEMLQHVLNDLENGVPNAFSAFVHAETERCLCALQALRL